MKRQSSQSFTHFSKWCVAQVLLAAIAWSAGSNAAPVVDQVNTADLVPTADVGESGVLGSVRGQSFTVGIGGRLTRIEFFLANRWDSPDSDPVLVKLVAGESDSTSTAIAGTAIPFSSVPAGTPGWVAADLSGANLVVMPGEVYTVWLSSNAAFLNHATWYANESYARGHGFAFGAACCTNPNLDFGFRSYVEPTPLPPGITDLGVLAGDDRSASLEISADGRMVTGYSYVGSLLQGFLWRPGGVLQSMRLPGDARGSVSLHSGGSVVTGQSCTADYMRCQYVVWTSTRGLESLTLPGDISSSGGSVSADGSTVIGYSMTGSTLRGVRWTSASGPSILAGPPGVSRVIGNALSADGSVVVGESTTTSGVKNAFIWRDSGAFQVLAPLPGDASSYATYVSPDGSVVAGHSQYAGGSPYSGHQRAFVWTASSGVEALVLPGEVRSNLGPASADGATLTGQSCSDADHCTSIAWSPQTGIQALPSPSGATWSGPTLVSADGGVIAGWASVNEDGGSATRGWVWTSQLGTMELQPLPGDAMTGVYGMSEDGSAVWAGSCSAEGSACRAILWSHPGLVTPLMLPGYAVSWVRAMSSDGQAVAGEACDASYARCEVFAWSEATGTQSLTLPGYETSFINGQKSMTADGGTIVGGACNADYLVCAPFVWRGTSGLEALDALPGHASAWANAVSADASAIIGDSFPPDGLAQRAVIWGVGTDNCPLVDNPDQSDIDTDGAGDVCDICPADAGNSCNVSGSTAGTIVAGEPGVVATPDGAVALNVEAGDLTSTTTISVTQSSGVDPDVNVGVGASADLGEAVAVYVFGPDGLQFSSPVTVTMQADVTALTPAQRADLGVYLYSDTNNDGIDDTYVRQPGVCTVTEPSPGTFVATCIVELSHFSTYALIGPRDSDGDGIPDDFGGLADRCVGQNAMGLDVDEDGCIDSFSGLTGLVNSLLAEGVIDANMGTSLLSKAANAAQSATAENVCAAVNQLGAFKAQVKALTGKKISEAASYRVSRYADSVIAAQLATLPPGASCQ